MPKVPFKWVFVDITPSTATQYHLISKCLRPPKENDKLQKQVRFNEKVNRACDKGENNSDQKIYASMAHMSGNEKFSSSKFW